MADLNLDPGYFKHRKTVRLIGLLGKGAEVLPIRLWAYYAEAHPDDDGRLTGYSTQEIESAAQWWGKPGEMVKGMRKVGFLDKDGETYSLHNWLDRQGHIKALKERSRKMNKARWAKLGGDSGVHTGVHQPSNHPTIPPPEEGGRKLSAKEKSYLEAKGLAHAKGNGAGHG